MKSDFSSNFHWPISHSFCTEKYPLCTPKLSCCVLVKIADTPVRPGARGQAFCWIVLLLPAAFPAWHFSIHAERLSYLEVIQQGFKKQVIWK